MGSVSGSVHLTTESNFVRLKNASTSSSQNGVVMLERNPHAVVLHNVDKFDVLTKVNKSQGLEKDGEYRLLPSEEYLRNLTLSF